ncbi:MAG: hypothetical protein AAFQ99_06420 [Pseudomonadota bacterium]
MSTTFWVVAIAMVLAGVLVATLPLWRGQRLLGTAAVAGGVLICVTLLYPIASNYTPRSPAFQLVREATDRETFSSAADMLSADLQKRPDDYLGWVVLGEARLRLGQPVEAVSAFRKAMNFATVPDPGLMVKLGDALTQVTGGERGLTQETVELYLAANQLAPDDPNTMFAAGLAYGAQGDNEAAADVWERLIRASEPPADVKLILQRQIAQWRGGTPPGDESGTQLALEVTLADALVRDLPDTARLFVSVRDPAQPGPPLAARQLPPNSLPLSLTLSDNDAMLAGRNLSSADAFVVTARISMSGDPIGGSGDLLGTLTVSASELPDTPLPLLIDRVVTR